MIRALALGALFAAALPARAEQCFDLALYGSVLQAHTRSVADVAGTHVDYAALKVSPQWAEVVKSLASCDPERLATREEKLAFWVNAYNVLAIDLVASHWPVASIKDIGSFLFPVWSKPAGQIHGKTYTLDQVETEHVRALGDPRVHAAINCASTSCPSLAREPYLAASIDAELDHAFAGFVSNRDKGFAIDREANTVRLSSIFKWFAADFEQQGGALRVIARYLGEDDRGWLGMHKDFTIEYMPYDWRVNGD
ncbi:MAG TPA: DUF547 domain-containing protein [Myxococcota bacterium]|nr:DUF547 domain-containing protein [Myxococcota bacterium]